MKESIPLFNFPTEVVFVDDDPSFLKSLISLLGDICSVKTFFNTDEAVDYLSRKSESDTKLLTFLNEARKSNLEDDEDEYRKININSLATTFCNRSHGLDTSVVFVDYNMQELNGIDFCQKIAKLSTKKVIMTAGMEEGKALKAFNQGIIDYYISKKDESFCDNLVLAINKMKTKFFVEQSKKLAIVRDVENDKNFQDEFNSFVKNKKILEYYAIDDFGSYIGLDEKNENRFFLCWNDKKLDELYSIAESCQADPFIVKSLKEKTHGVYLFSESDRQKKVSEWKKYLYPIKGSLNISDSTYYYSYS